MVHSVFQTAQIMPLAHTTNKLSSRPLLPASANPRLPVWPSNTVKTRKCCLDIKTSLPAVVGGDAAAHLERCFLVSPPGEGAPSSSASSSSVEWGPVMKGKFGSVGAVTLEKSKLDLSQKQTTKSAAEEFTRKGTVKNKYFLRHVMLIAAGLFLLYAIRQLATGGGGGNMGKGLSHGGGDGGDDGGDDDDYFDNFDEGDDGDNDGLFRRRIIISELFDRKFVDAVLNEWQKTMMDLPTGFRQAYEMGLVSSAQMVKFLAINARPTTERFISRALPQGMSRAFIGRMIADPAFFKRLVFELATTTGCSVCWEIKNRKERIKKEWDLALVNVLTVTACNAIVFWSLAPCRSYGNTFQFDLQNTLQKLPNNIFEKSYPLREFDFQKRLMSFFYKTAQFCMVGFTAGTVQGAMSNLAASRKEGRLSVTIPSVSNNALGYGAFLGLYANLRYQLLCGVDRAVINYFDVIGVALFFSTALRVLNVQLGEMSRLAWLGVEVDPLVYSDDLLKAYNRPSEGVSQSSSKWFISKNAIVSGLGLLGIKQGKNDSNSDDVSPPTKTRRKRVVRRKVASS